MLARSIIPSPVGSLTLVADAAALVAVLWQEDDPCRVVLGDAMTQPDQPVLVETAAQLDDYFAGRRTSFTVPIALRGTPFQNEVWSALREIPFGETRSYADIARRIGRPSAVRAVGAANGRNPISIIIPCHRVVGTSGALTGFAGGLPAKRHLLALEGRRESPDLPLFAGHSHSIVPGGLDV